MVPSMSSSLSRKRPRESAVCKRFFKVMSEGFEKKIAIPEAFSRNLTEDELSAEFATLKAPGESSSWKVKIQKGNNKSLLYFKAGWEDFVVRHRLKLWDFVVFEHKGGMVFSTLLFGVSACEKDFPFPTDFSSFTVNRPKINSTKFRDRVGKGKVKMHVANSHFSNGKPSFQATILDRHGRKDKPYLNIPRQFINTNDLYGTDKVSLKAPSGKYFEVKLYFPPERKYVYFYTGWYEFYVSNNLKIGDVCTFELTGSEVGKKINFTVHIRRAQKKFLASISDPGHH